MSKKVIGRIIFIMGVVIAIETVWCAFDWYKLLMELN